VTFTAHDSLVLFGILVAATTLIGLSAGLSLPFPVLLVLGGLGLGFVPGVPDVELSPDLVLVVFLPPLLYWAAFFTSIRELRRKARPISMLAFGLVGVTTLAVAAVAHAAIPGLSWPAAFVLGAIVSPTDAPATTSIARRLGVPRGLLTVVEGESLINDAAALVAYRFAVVAVLTGTFSLGDAALRLAGNVAAGIAIGLAVGWVIKEVRRRIDNAPVEITISLMTGYFAYLPAEAADVSAVLATVTAGIYIGWYSPEISTVAQRLQGTAVWELLVFAINAVLFIVVGLQLPVILDGLSGRSTGSLLLYATLVSVTVIAIRVVWVFVGIHMPRALSGRRRGEPLPPVENSVFIAWTGMRGAVSLAAALALPRVTDAGTPFPERDLIIFLTFAVILATVVLQGLTLPLLLRFLGLEDDGLDAEEEAMARIRAAESALARLEELAGEDWVREDTAQRMRGTYEFRRSRFTTRLDGTDGDGIEERSAAYQRLRREMLDAEREAIVDLRRSGEIHDGVMYRLARDLDLEESRLDA
jgi:CPA1 family monovalent cation:H+ antiporter